ncbi:hypothetical protein ACFL02_07005 [Planctomycetota bacterium]
MKEVLKLGLSSLYLVFLFGFDLPDGFGTESQRRTGMDQQGNRGEVGVFELEEFSVFEEKLPPKYKFLQRGQYSVIGDEPNPKVKVYPELKSEKPVYGWVIFNHGLFYSNRFGTEYYFVVDESGGTGKGYDLFYFDLNNDFDLSDDEPLKPTSKSSDENLLQLVKEGEDLPPLEIMFEAFTLVLSSGRVQRGQPEEIKIIPKFIKSGDQHQFTYVMFVAAAARRGKIKLGSKEMEVILARYPYITSRFNSLISGLYLDDEHEPDPFLCTMRNIDGKLYNFSASPDGNRLFVRSYEGDFGFLEVGKTAGELKDAKFTAGSLVGRRNIVSLEDCPKEGDKIKIPAGNYRPNVLLMKSEKLAICLSGQAMMGGQFEEEGAGDQNNIQITPDKPFAFDFTHETEVEFIRPQVNEVFKPGEEVRVASMINIPDMDLQLMAIHDPTAKYVSGVGFGSGKRSIIASIHPVVKIINSSGMVMHEGKMPFG